MWTWREIRDGATLVLGFAGVVFVVALVMTGCGGEGGDHDAAAEIAEANGLPTESNTVNCGGSVTVTQGGDGTINARGGDCAIGAEEEEEDEDDVSPAPQFGPGQEVPRFQTPMPG